MSGIIREVELPIHDERTRGKLVPVELQSAVPFEVKRVYYLWNITTGAVRGSHAHTIEKEFFICIRGRCAVKVSSDGTAPYKVILASPNRGIFVDNLVWHEFVDFSPDAILLAFSSTSYMPDNYINDFAEFAKVAKRSC